MIFNYGLESCKVRKYPITQVKKKSEVLVRVNIIFPLFLALIFFGCYNTPDKDNLKIKEDPAYPRWLKSGSYFTQQTSGNCFLGLDKEGNKNFLLADDIGKIHHFRIKNDTIFSFSKVVLGEKVKTYLQPFPKWDFEEIVYDKYTNSVYISIEGNNPEPKKYVGIYKLIFNNDNVYSDTVAGIEKLDIKPQNLFLKYIANNIGYEGLAVDKNFFYLGLEGFSSSGIFADSTFLFIVDKKDLRIIKQLDTKPLGIHTICGLYSDMDNSVYGIDRNNKKLFHLLFDESGKHRIKKLELTDISTNIPDYPDYDYVAALESITMDNKKNIYFIDDPWKTFYVPQENILEKLDSTTVNNFKKFIPIIYKFKLIEPAN